jgi:peptide/nickel transport system permease protein
MAIAGPVGGAVIIERVFGLPGLGDLAVTSLARRDLPVVLGVVVTVMVIVLVLNVITDILYTFIDPRVRLAPASVEPSTQRPRRAEPVPVTEPA